MNLATRHALETDVSLIKELSSRVQSALKASGSLQVIGPLESAIVKSAINEQQCSVMKDNSNRPWWCAFIKRLGVDYFPSTAKINILNFQRPWY